MSAKSAIEWTDATWNPVTGCTKVSQGCKNCYAEREWPRLQHLPAYTGRTFTDVRCHPDRLDEPLRWRRPRKIFVCHNADLFHESVPDEFIHRVFGVMGPANQHIFQVLTKRPKRMLAFVKSSNRPAETPFGWYFGGPFPLKNVWLGVSVEDQVTADERIPPLLQTPAAVHWISAEPLLSEINLRAIDLGDLYWLNAMTGTVRIAHDGGMPAAPDYGRLKWVVTGGESGPKARPMRPDWVRALRDQCQAAGVPFFFKQWGEWAYVSMYEMGGYYMDDQHGVHKLRDDQVCPHVVNLGHKALMGRVGKKAAGRMLDGLEWNEYPT